ncbi:hypothetical protein M422DRAFT_254679 [Sphaerobolus stellatus SS14]|uniref:Uncharacterized protein n=1 Tax=Sphaerobolus stellatus (strain SS14) TaxID=990650 RepID=A0A0C9VUL0_SPHS4|nr:hypothetical protein M422DRAFT_254679 [Sphaerobolus stellatus SS14]
MFKHDHIKPTNKSPVQYGILISLHRRSLFRSPSVTRTLSAVETSRLSKSCPRLEMVRCSQGGLTAGCKELKGNSDRQLLNRDVVRDILTVPFALTAALSSLGESTRAAAGAVTETKIVLRCYLDGHRATTTVSSTNPFCAHTLAMERKVHAVLVLGGADERSSCRSLPYITTALSPSPPPLYGVTETDDVSSKWSFVISLMPFLSPVKASRGISSYPNERSYVWYGS